MLSDKKTFEITEDHLALLQRMYVSYDAHAEHGAPEIDPKCPYGNSDVKRDMAEILDRDLFDPQTGERDQDVVKELDKLHSQMETVLQILVRHPVSGIQTGTYEADQYSSDWKLADE